MQFTEELKQNGELLELAARIAYYQVMDKSHLPAGDFGNFESHYNHVFDPNNFFVLRVDEVDGNEKEIFIPFSEQYPKGQEWSSFIKETFYEGVAGTGDNTLGYYIQDTFINSVHSTEDFYNRQEREESILNIDLDSEQGKNIGEKLDPVAFMYNSMMIIFQALKETVEQGYDVSNATVAMMIINEIFEFPDGKGLQDFDSYELLLNDISLADESINPEQSESIYDVSVNLLQNIYSLSALKKYEDDTPIKLQNITNIESVLSEMEDGLTKEDFVIAQHFQYMPEYKIRTDDIPIKESLNDFTLEKIIPFLREGITTSLLVLDKGLSLDVNLEQEKKILKHKNKLTIS